MTRLILLCLLLALPLVASAEPVTAAIALFLVEAGVEATVAGIVASFAVSSAISFAVSLFASKPASGGYQSAIQDRTHVVRSAIQARNIIYGEVITSGPLAFAASTDKGTDKNKYLHLVVVLAAHEVNAITEVYFNDDLLPLDANGLATSGRYYNGTRSSVTETIVAPAGAASFNVSGTIASLVSVSADSTLVSGEYLDQTAAYPVAATFSGSTVYVAASGLSVPYTVVYESANAGSFVRVKKHLGQPGQVADADLIAECPSFWTANHILTGCAYLYVRLEYDPNAFVTGIPNIRARVQGKKLYDPRSATTYYTNNYALCMNDYMTSPDGLGCTAADIDQPSLIASANSCDEGVQVSLDNFYARYVANGVIPLDHAPEENIRTLATAGGGPAPILAGGVFYIHVGAYDTPTVTLTESDLRGPVKMRPRMARKDLFNAVKGTYVDGDGNTFQPVDYPIVRNALYVANDAGVEIVRDLQLPFTTSGITAQRMAKIALERSRQGITVEFPCKISGFKLQAWDTVMLSLAKFGWTNKVFRVVSWTFNTNSGVDLVLQEEAAGVYAWNFGMQTTVDLAPDTNLPAPNIVAPVTAISLTSGTADLVLSDGGITSRIHVIWTKAESSLQYYGGSIYVEYKRLDDAVFTPLPAFNGAVSDCYIAPVEDSAYYTVRVRVESNLGALSPWTYSLPHKVIGKTEPPANVNSFLYARQPDGTRQFSWGWTGQKPIDLAGYRIKYTQSLPATWEAMTLLHSDAGFLVASPYETNQLLAGSYTFAIKTVDTTGNEALNALFITATLDNPRLGKILIAESDFAAGFLGVKTGASVVSGFLEGNDTSTWSTIPAAWDAWSRWRFAPLSPIVYEHPLIDIGAIVTFKPIIQVDADGAVTLTESHSTDGVTYTPYATPTTSIIARYVKVRISVAGAYPLVRELLVWLEANTKTEDINDLNTATAPIRFGVGDIRLPVRNSYSVISQVAVVLQNVPAGYSWVLIDKNTSGPRIKIYDANNAPADALIDAYIKGY